MVAQSESNPCADITGKCNDTVTRYSSKFQKSIYSVIELEETIIEGQGVEVQINEEKFWKSKFNRWHSVFVVKYPFNLI